MLDQLKELELNFKKLILNIFLIKLSKKKKKNK